MRNPSLDCCHNSVASSELFGVNLMRASIGHIAAAHKLYVNPSHIEDTRGVVHELEVGDSCMKM